ncbi:hypothetical protein D3C87_2195020 [compost metagenome]
MMRAGPMRSASAPMNGEPTVMITPVTSVARKPIVGGNPSWRIEYVGMYKAR